MKNNPNYYACIINDVINEALKNNINVVFDGNGLILESVSTYAEISFQNLKKRVK